jgi:hypothetical protein
MNERPDTQASSGNDGEHPWDKALSGSVRRLQSMLSELQRLLSCDGGSDREMLLRDGLRHAVRQLAGVLSEAATLQPHGSLSTQCRTLSQAALDCSRGRAGRHVGH